MKMTRNEMHALNMALQFRNSELGVQVEAQNELESMRTGAALTWGVNWSAKGTQNPDAARRYAQALQAAAEIAIGLTRLKIVEDWNLEETLVDRRAVQELALGLAGNAFRPDYGQTLDEVVITEQVRELVNRAREKAQA